MEPLRKRPRVSQVTDKTILNPDIDLLESRARNDLRLKSTFEAIFKKYDHDFTGIGDEIDLQTGDIVVNNGHIMDMRSEHDIGDRKTGRNKDWRASMTAIGDKRRSRETSLLSDDFDRLSNGPHEEGRIFANIGVQSDDDDADSLLGLEQDTNLQTEPDPQMEDTWSIGDGGRDSVNWKQSASPRGLPSQQAIQSQFGPLLGLQIADLVRKVRDPNDMPVEEAWRVPCLAAAPTRPRAILESLVNMHRERSHSPLNQASIWALARSKGRPKKDGSVVFGDKTPTGNNQLTMRPEPLVPDDVLVEPMRNHDDEIEFADDSYHTGSNPESSMRHLHSTQDNDPDLCTIQQSNTDSQHQILLVPVNKKASYITPKSSPSSNPNILRNSKSSPLKRKRLQQSKHRIDIGSEEGQSLRKLDIRPGQITTYRPGAECLDVASPRSDQLPLVSRKQQINCVRWTEQEEERLRHLKETTDLAYARLVEYFPGRNRQNIRAHYLTMMANIELRSRKEEPLPVSPYTLEEDELLVELKVDKELPWSAITTSFPAKSINSLKHRYYKVLQATPRRMNQTTSEGSTSATSEDLLHIGPLKTRLGVTPTEHEMLEDRTSTDLLDRERRTHSSPERSEADPKPLGEVLDNRQRPTTSRMVEKTPSGERTATLGPSSSAAPKVAAQPSGSEQQQGIAHGEGTTTVLATADSRLRRQSRDKNIGVERNPSAKGEASQRSKSSQKKTSQSGIPKSTPTASKIQKVTKPRNPQAAGTKASRKTLTPRSKAALVSLLGDVTDDEDELSNPVTTLGSSKDKPLATPKRTVGECVMGSNSCNRKFCFKCS